MSVAWNDAAGKQIGSSSAISFPYHPVDWDLGDRFVLAPAGAAQLVVAASLNNHSQKQTGKNIPSALGAFNRKPKASQQSGLCPAADTLAFGFRLNDRRRNKSRNYVRRTL